MKVVLATSSTEALELARALRPTPVSLDVYLPDMLGWAALSRLKQSPETRHIPVQALTLDEDRQHGLGTGAFSFMRKPTTMDGLRAAITHIKDYARPCQRRLLVVEDDPPSSWGSPNFSATTTSR